LLYIFERNAAGTFVQRARIEKTASEHGFGHQVAMTKREIVVGSSGSAFIFGRNSSGNWAQRQKLLPANPDTLDFGGAVAIDRGMILVGAPNTLGPFDRQGGTLHGFVPGTSKYVEIFEIQSPRGRLVSFGNFIAMFGNRIAVSAERWMDDPEPAAPALVLTYTRDGSSIRPLGEVQFGSFPAPIAIANNALMVGSPIEGMCRFVEFGCVGQAGFFDLNRLQ